ncbi:MAG: hypothetical protein JSU63_19525 [Phycisphaerales bacterium]|nr:MAG: hypothetical protein JSU63_19525 [Phycisphaerales bacterium]
MFHHLSVDLLRGSSALRSGGRTVLPLVFCIALVAPRLLAGTGRDKDSDTANLPDASRLSVVEKTHVRPALSLELTPIPLSSVLGQPVEGKIDTFTPRIAVDVADDGCLTGLTIGHSDADFTGDTFWMQAGFVDNEVAIASYVRDPTEFPIVIESVEAVLGQIAGVPTETHYSFLIWDGPPDTGILKYSFSSDDIEIQHARMPMGIEGLNIKIAIDPGEPEQLVIYNDSEANMFSVGFRIDKHNLPPEDPCDFLNPPDPGQNAFPVVDFSGVASFTGNWLKAIPCGNACDGLNTFGDLSPLVCQPSGDWAIRATYRCAPRPGACCESTGECTDDVEPTSCSGLFMGRETICANVTCPEQTGACCIDEACIPEVTASQCSGFGGTYVGDTTDCFDLPCNPGACCHSDGTCDEVTAGACEAAGGSFQGVNTLCSTADCPQPTGACCIGCGCLDGRSEEECIAVGVWGGTDSTCDELVCSPGGSIYDAYPPAGTVDARQPHPPGDQSLAALNGIGGEGEEIILIIGASGATPNCFTFCETAADPMYGPNAIADVGEVSPGIYALRLDRPINAGAATTISYADGSYVEYVSHPANANDDGVANTVDILFLVDMLNEVESPPHGLHSQDIDHSGVFNTADILRLVDLLNGAGVYTSWFLSPTPVNTSCP